MRRKEKEEKSEGKKEMRYLSVLPLALMLLHCAVRNNPQYTPEQQFFANSYEFLADAAKLHEASMVSVGELHAEGLLSDATLFRARTIGKSLEVSLRAYRTAAKLALDAGTGNQREILLAMGEVTRLLADILEIVTEHQMMRAGGPLQ